MESEGESNTFLLTREQQTAVTARLGELGLVSAADNINMVNYDKVEDFYAAYQEGKDALITIFYVDPEGGMSALTFVYRKGRGCRLILQPLDGMKEELPGSGEAEPII